MEWKDNFPFGYFPFFYDKNRLFSNGQLLVMEF